MNPIYLSMLFTISAVTGAIICGLALSNGKSSTKWLSKLGIWTIAGLILLAVGLGGSVTMMITVP